jgi:hypothetical protein
VRFRPTANSVSPLIWGKGLYWFLPIVKSMEKPDEKSCQDKEAKRELSRLEEIGQIVEEYANDLWEIIRKLRSRFH